MATSPAPENNQSLLKQCTACVERAWRDRVHLHTRRVELCVSDIVRTPVLRSTAVRETMVAGMACVAKAVMREAEVSALRYRRATPTANSSNVAWCERPML